MPSDTPPPWNQTLHHSLWRAGQTMHRSLNEGLGGLGVTITQLGMMTALWENGPLSAADLARHHGITPQSVNTALCQLDKLGWLVRTPHPVHKRVVLIDLTEVGRAGVVAGRRVTEEVVARITGALGGEAEAQRFIGELRRVTAELDGPEAPVLRMWPDPPAR